jgi:hypothetical protein
LAGGPQELCSIDKCQVLLLMMMRPTAAAAAAAGLRHLPCQPEPAAELGRRQNRSSRRLLLLLLPRLLPLLLDAAAAAAAAAAGATFLAATCMAGCKPLEGRQRPGYMRKVLQH